MEEKKISSAVIKRLPRYYRYLSELLEKGIDRISSHELSKKMNVTASQIRQDFNNFGGFGQQGYGYKYVVSSDKSIEYHYVLDYLVDGQDVVLTIREELRYDDDTSLLEPLLLDVVHNLKIELIGE